MKAKNIHSRTATNSIENKIPLMLHLMKSYSGPKKNFDISAVVRK